MAAEIAEYQARQLAKNDFDFIIDPNIGIPACGDKGVGEKRYKNLFARDACWSIIEGFYFPEICDSESDRYFIPALTSLNLIAQNQTKFILFPDLDEVKERVLINPRESVIFPGANLHELHNRFTPQERLQHLIATGRKPSQDQDGFTQLVMHGEADDVQGLFVLAFEKLINAIDTRLPDGGRELSDQILEQYWPYIEANLLYDILYADKEGDGLIKTYPKKGDKQVNRTWRDSWNAVVLNPQGAIPLGPYIFFENACFSVASRASGARLAERLGLSGYASMFEKKYVEGLEKIDQAFWMEDEGCFAVLNYANGIKHDMVTNETLIGMFAQTIYPERAALSAKRMQQDDLMTDLGTRTLSIEDPRAVINGPFGYHKSTVWLQLNTSGALGARYYGERDLERALVAGACNYVLENGVTELVAKDRNGVTQAYREEGKNKSCDPQAWGDIGIQSITHPALIKGRNFQKATA